MSGALDHKRDAEALGSLELPTGTGVRRVAAAARRRLGWAASFLRWRWRFGGFGWRSVLRRPDLLTGTRRIRIGRGVEIRPGARLEALGAGVDREERISIGDGTSIHFYFHCGAARRVEIGKNVLIAGRVYVTDHDHDLGEPGLPPVTSRRLQVEPTRIADDCWLGEGSMVLKGVQLGRGCVVAAGAVVTRSFDPYTLVAGVPARPLRRWDPDRRSWAAV